MLVIDHVVMLVPDARGAAEELRREHGLGSESSGYLPLAGTIAYNMPLRPPSYLEFHGIVDRAAAARTNAGRIALGCPNNGDRTGRWRAMYERVGHSCAPGRFSELAVGGSRDELDEWLGPHDLPLRFVDGPPGIAAVRIATADGDVELANPPR